MSSLAIAHAVTQSFGAAPAGTSYPVVPSTGYHSHTGCKSNSLDVPRAFILVSYDSGHVPRGKIPQDPFDENVYNLIPLLLPPPEHHERYRSKFAKMVRREYKNGRKEAASMGPVVLSPSKPQNYLKKHEGVSRAPPVTSAKAQPKMSYIRSTLHANVLAPSKEQKERELAAKAPKNYIKANALETINAIPKQHKDQEQRYTQLKTYAKVPEYLVARKYEQEEKERQKDVQKAQQERNAILASGLIPLPEDERLRILQGLKTNWEKLNSEYMRLSLTVDTVPKINKKVSLENALKQLEADIEKFSNTNILVDFNSVYQSKDALQV